MFIKRFNHTFTKDRQCVSSMKEIFMEDLYFLTESTIVVADPSSSKCLAANHIPHVTSAYIRIDVWESYAVEIKIAPFVKDGSVASSVSSSSNRNVQYVCFHWIVVDTL